MQGLTLFAVWVDAFITHERCLGASTRGLSPFMGGLRSVRRHQKTCQVTSDLRDASNPNIKRGYEV